MTGYFITGTDTGVGKSLVTAALLYAAVERGFRAAGMKPVAAGAVWTGTHWYNEDVAMITAAGNVALPPELVCPYVLQEAAAPHIAAALENVRFDLAHMQDCLERIRQQADIVCVEGVGGFCVPLTEQQDTADLAVHFGLPVILVVGMRLGCINHSLLTVEAIRARGLTLAGWVANQIDPDMTHVAANLAALAARIPAPLLGHIPHIRPGDAGAAAEHLDISLLPD